MGSPSISSICPDLRTFNAQFDYICNKHILFYLTVENYCIGRSIMHFKTILVTFPVVLGAHFTTKIRIHSSRDTKREMRRPSNLLDISISTHPCDITYTIALFKVFILHFFLYKSKFLGWL